MRMILRGLMPASLAFVACADLAVAADLGGPRQEWRAPGGYYPQMFRWTGFYAGVQAGYGWGGTDAVTAATLGGGLAETFSYSTGGWLGGVHAGYNWQSGPLVLGLETDIETSGVEGSGRGTFGGGHLTAIDWMGSLRGRLGYAAGNTLLYVTGGLAYGDVTLERAWAGGITTGSTGWTTGWTVGGGIEHAFSQTVSLRLEYRYTDFGQISYSSPVLGITDTSDVTHSAVRAGLSFKF
jgi:outer membrane immunogenic protein